MINTHVWTIDGKDKTVRDFIFKAAAEEQSNTDTNS